ncbi:MAG: DctP family TRAP transporter solute-binding subunit [Pedobacter sp.]
MRRKLLICISAFTVIFIIIISSIIWTRKWRMVGTAPAYSNKVYKLQFGHDLAADSAQHVAALKFASLVEQRTAGRVNIRVYPDHQLGNDHEMIEATRNGDLAITLAPTAKLSSIVPAMQYVDLPFLFPSREDAYELLDGEPGRMILEQLNAYGLVGVTYWEIGFKQFTANRSIRLPSDFNGLNVRVMKSPLIMDQFKAFGANPIPIEFQQTYQALFDGVVDAQENPLVSIVNRKFYEVQSDVVISNHAYLGSVFLISKKMLDSLPKDLRETLIVTAQELTSFEREETQEREKRFLEMLETKGVHIYFLNPKEREKFRAATEHIVATYRDIIGPQILDMTFQYLDKKSVFEGSEAIVIGLDADMTLGSGSSGLAIKRGMELAVDDINMAGGLLGKKLKIITRDHGGISARGLRNMDFFSGVGNLVAVMGGLHSPVALSELDFIHRKKIIYLDPWAAATDIVNNGYDPNYVFRISANDRDAGQFIVEQALHRYKNIALLLENTGWGRSNYQAITETLSDKGVMPVEVQWFNWGETDMTPQLTKITDSGADVLLMVANAPEGVNIIRSMSKLSWKLPILSHWGITGGDFWAHVHGDLKLVDLQFLQTFSFLSSENEKARNLGERYCQKYHLPSTEMISVPCGTAHAYDLVHLLGKAIIRAGSFDRPTVRDALEKVGSYHGVLKTYEPPFTVERHDALSKKDFFLARYDDYGHIIPVTAVGRQ